MERYINLPKLTKLVYGRLGPEPPAVPDSKAIHFDHNSCKLSHRCCVTEWSSVIKMAMLIHILCTPAFLEKGTT